jgi:ABC-2 type transport system ATP-binding protein
VLYSGGYINSPFPFFKVLYMPIIQVRNLSKTFRSKHKPAGLRSSLRALAHPEWKTIEAVKDLTFEMEQGELMGFIGPNGAGKSTTIKMLTGILYLHLASLRC